MLRLLGRGNEECIQNFCEEMSWKTSSLKKVDIDLLKNYYEDKGRTKWSQDRIQWWAYCLSVQVRWIFDLWIMHWTESTEK